MSEFQDRIPWEKKYYCDIQIPQILNSIKCQICEEVFSSEEKYIRYFTMHLYTSHKITELNEHPEREFLLEKFIIYEETARAICQICDKVIYYDKYGMYLLKNHVELYHGNYSHIYKRIAEIKSGCYTLDKYFIMGSEATCPKCELKIDTTHSETHTREKLKELFEHYFSHRYKKKCFKFANMRKWILFYFFCSNNFIIIRYKRYYD